MPCAPYAKRVFNGQCFLNILKTPSLRLLQTKLPPRGLSRRRIRRRRIRERRIREHELFKHDVFHGTIQNRPRILISEETLAVSGRRAMDVIRRRDAGILWLQVLPHCRHVAELASAVVPGEILQIKDGLVDGEVLEYADRMLRDGAVLLRGSEDGVEDGVDGRGVTEGVGLDPLLARQKHPSH